MFGKKERTAGANMYGVHPTYTVMETEGEGFSHQVLLLNSNAQVSLVG